jgi:hypothetical protein
MARIPKFQRQSLASTLVGTPGFDQAGRDTQRALASFTPAIQSVQNFAAQRQIAINETEANKTVIDFETRLNELTNTFRQEFEQSPTGSTDIYRERVDTLYNDTLAQTSNDFVRQTVARRAQSPMRLNMAQHQQWEFRQEAVVAVNNIQSSAQTLALEANRMGGGDKSPDELGRLLDQMDGTLTAATGVLSAEQQTQFQQNLPKSIIAGYIKGRVQINPEAVQELIDNEVFTEHFTVDELAKFKREAIVQENMLQKNAQQQLTQRQQASRFDVVSRILQGDNPPTMGDVESLVESGRLSFKDGEDILEMLISPEKQEDNFHIVSDLNVKLVEGELTVDDIVENNVHLTKATQRKYLNQLTSDIRGNPAIRRAIRLLDSEIEEQSLGVRLPEDERIFNEAVDELIERSLLGQEQVFTVTEEIRKRMRDEKQFEQTRNKRRRELKKKFGRKMRRENIEKAQQELIKRFRLQEISSEEANLEASILEEFLDEVNQ